MYELCGKSAVVTTILLSSVLWSCGAQTADVDDRHIWKTYVNARFAYSICYPSDVLSPQGESDNGDGQRFVTKDGRAKVFVYGSYFASNGENQTLKKAYLDEIQSDQEQGFTITYKFLKNDEFVISGSRSGKIFYQKTVLVKGVFKTIRFEYAADVKQEFDPIASRMSSCFHTKVLSKSSA